MRFMHTTVLYVKMCVVAGFFLLQIDVLQVASTFSVTTLKYTLSSRILKILKLLHVKRYTQVSQPLAVEVLHDFRLQQERVPHFN